MTDARDAEQLSKNKVTHILSVHDSARPMLEVRELHTYFHLCSMGVHRISTKATVFSLTPVCTCDG